MTENGVAAGHEAQHGTADAQATPSTPAQPTPEQLQQWQAFKAEQVPQALSEASRLSQTTTEDKPYDAKYEAARVLEGCGRQAAAFKYVPRAASTITVPGPS